MKEYINLRVNSTTNMKIRKIKILFNSPGMCENRSKSWEQLKEFDPSTKTTKTVRGRTFAMS